MNVISNRKLPDQTGTSKIRALIVVFMIATVWSGITAFPIEWELGVMHTFCSRNCPDSAVTLWINKVYEGVTETYSLYPFMAYGTDWLAFAHIVIALAFIGPLRDPVRNIWVIEWGMLASILVFPLAFIAGPLREIPFFHQLIDCSFGVIGFILLYIIRRQILQHQKSE
ncbi:MAG TPA: hypothetical protein VE978_01015 [Chitinophagales bacterium]|nr:hypothetical protein [Chitinophagales bacterium]